MHPKIFAEEEGRHQAQNRRRSSFLIVLSDFSNDIRHLYMIEELHSCSSCTEARCSSSRWYNVPTYIPFRLHFDDEYNSGHTHPDIVCILRPFLTICSQLTGALKTVKVTDAIRIF